MRLIVINLARAHDRRQTMTAQFAERGLAVEILTATDGLELTDQERSLVDHAARKAITPYPLSDNEIGCWLSHLRALRSVADGPDEMVAIFEDDTKLLANFTETLAAIEAQRPSFDFLFLHRKFGKREIFAPTRALLPDYAIGRVGYTHMCLHAFVVSRAGARKFLASKPRIAHAVDKEIHRFWANGLDIYGLEQPVAEHDDGGHSFIEETRSQDRPERLRYPDADRLYWRWRRFMTKTSDSWRKRLFFAGYARRGRARAQERGGKGT